MGSVSHRMPLYVNSIAVRRLITFINHWEIKQFLDLRVIKTERIKYGNLGQILVDGNKLRNIRISQTMFYVPSFLFNYLANNETCGKRYCFVGIRPVLCFFHFYFFRNNFRSGKRIARRIHGSP
jgi:hypothetical protein